MSPLMFSTGILMGYIVGGYVSYSLIPLSAIFSFIYLILTFLFIPETPQFLLSRGENEVRIFFNRIKKGKIQLNLR